MREMVSALLQLGQTADGRSQSKLVRTGGLLQGGSRTDERHLDGPSWDTIMRGLNLKMSRLAQSQRSDQVVATISVLWLAELQSREKLSARLLSGGLGKSPDPMWDVPGEATLFSIHTDKRLELQLYSKLVHICWSYPGELLRCVRSCFKRSATLGCPRFRHQTSASRLPRSKITKIRNQPLNS